MAIPLSVAIYKLDLHVSRQLKAVNKGAVVNFEVNQIEPEILEKAEKIIVIDKSNLHNLQLCVEAKICPECGEPITIKEIYITEFADWQEHYYICTKCDLATRTDDYNATYKIKPIPKNFR